MAPTWSALPLLLSKPQFPCHPARHPWRPSWVPGPTSARPPRPLLCWADHLPTVRATVGPHGPQRQALCPLLPPSLAPGLEGWAQQGRGEAAGLGPGRQVWAPRPRGLGRVHPWGQFHGRAKASPRLPAQGPAPALRSPELGRTVEGPSREVAGDGLGAAAAGGVLCRKLWPPQHMGSLWFDPYRGPHPIN